LRRSRCPCLRLGADLLCRALRRTLLATGEPSSKYAFNAVLCEVDQDDGERQFRVVATDSLRLAAAEISAEGQLTPSSHLLPRIALDLVARLGVGFAGHVDLVLGETRVAFRVGAGVVWARPVRGDFPDWRKVLSIAPRYRVPATVGPLLSAVRLAAAIRGELTERVVLRFEPGRVLLESRRDKGRARVRRPLPLSGAVVEVALRAGDLIELLKVLSLDEVIVFGVEGGAAPVLVFAGDGYCHALMPLLPVPQAQTSTSGR
jgi:DNA polymerase-3 subunit beta